jgi:hypothetical protein
VQLAPYREGEAEVETIEELQKRMLTSETRRDISPIHGRVEKKAVAGRTQGECTAVPRANILSRVVVEVYPSRHPIGHPACGRKME